MLLSVEEYFAGCGTVSVLLTYLLARFIGWKGITILAFIVLAIALYGAAVIGYMNAPYQFPA